MGTVSSPTPSVHIIWTGPSTGTQAYRRGSSSLLDVKQGQGQDGEWQAGQLWGP